MVVAVEENELDTFFLILLRSRCLTIVAFQSSPSSRQALKHPNSILLPGNGGL
jgi:hypothetical protein